MEMLAQMPLHDSAATVNSQLTIIKVCSTNQNIQKNLDDSVVTSNLNHVCWNSDFDVSVRV